MAFARASRQNHATPLAVRPSLVTRTHTLARASVGGTGVGYASDTISGCDMMSHSIATSWRDVNNCPHPTDTRFPVPSLARPLKGTETMMHALLDSLMMFGGFCAVVLPVATLIGA